MDIMSTPTTHRPLVVLDLDECLVHWAPGPLSHEPYLIEPEVGCLYLRPHLGGFLRGTSRLYDLAIWSAGSPALVALVARLLAKHVQVDWRFVWDRRRCTLCRDKDGTWYSRKPLQKLETLGYQLGNVLVVDNDPRTFESNYGNGIAVRDFKGQLDDRELSCLLRYLQMLAPLAGRFRSIEKRAWRERSLNAIERA